MRELNPYESPQASEPEKTPTPAPTPAEDQAAVDRSSRWLLYAGGGMVLGFCAFPFAGPPYMPPPVYAGFGGVAGLTLGAFYELFLRERG